MSEYDAWAPVYDAWSAAMTEDVGHDVQLAREADGAIVELMVGSGRVAIDVVRETGRPVLGIDSSPAMLEIARERAAGLPLELRLGDVRDLSLDEPAALAGENRIDIERDDGATLKLWWATRSEWQGLIDVAGLEVEALYGGFRREPYDDDAKEMVWVARKA